MVDIVSEDHSAAIEDQPRESYLYRLDVKEEGADKAKNTAFGRETLLKGENETFVYKVIGNELAVLRDTELTRISL